MNYRESGIFFRPAAAQQCGLIVLIGAARSLDEGRMLFEN